MLITEAVNAYTRFRSASGFSPGTVKNDGIVLRSLRDSIGNIAINKITPNHIDQHLSRLDDRGMTPATINLHHAHLSSFFKWARSRKVIKPDSDPMAGRRYRKFARKPQARIDISQFPAAIAALKAPRDQFLMALCLHLMLRTSEIVTIRLKDVDLDDWTIFVHIKKTKQYDYMPIAPDLRPHLLRWLAHYESEMGGLDPEWYLVPTQRLVKGGKWLLEPSRPIDKPERTIRKGMEAVGVDRSARIGVHTARRSAARALHDEMIKEAGHDQSMLDVAAWLHHSSTKTTELYLGLEVDRARRDRKYKDQPMYPSLADPNVIPIGDANAHRAM